MAAGNTGGDKTPMFAFGKSLKPRCFKNVKFSIRRIILSIQKSKKSWMDGVFLAEWVQKLDRKFSSEGRSVTLYNTLVIDNCPTHRHIENLTAINLFSSTQNNSSN